MTTHYYSDDPWRRLAWVVPLSLVLWAAMLTAFALLLERTAPPSPELLPAQVRIVELPPTGGLPAGAPAAHPAAAQPKPKVEAVKPPPLPRIRPATPAKMHHARRKALVPPAPPSPAGSAKPSTQAQQASREPAVTGEASNSASGSMAGQTSGIGSESSGARAIYSPAPEIPENLRDQPLQTVAVAHFKISYDGQVQVSLITPTENPELNQILLDTLKQWRFSPAIKSGISVDSQFDVRIPISVQ